MPHSYHVLAPAKVNLRLKITGRRSDGHHLLSMLNAPLDLADKITLTFTSKADISVSSVEFGELINPSPSQRNKLESELLSESNLLVRAALVCREQLGFSEGINFELQKNIPLGAGLGGGSSDAGAAAKFLFDKFGNRKKREEFVSKLAAIGSDIPFCFYSQPAWVRGVGDQITILPDKVSQIFSDKECMLVFPNIHVSTVTVYDSYRNKNPEIKTLHDRDMDRLFDVENLSTQEIWEIILSLLCNDLESALSPKYEALEQCLMKLRSVGIRACMTGSGSTVLFLHSEGIFSNHFEQLKQLEDILGSTARFQIVRFL